MELRENVIIINGAIRTDQVDSIQLDGDRYAVRFNRSPKIYHYGSDKIIWLNHHDSLDISNRQIFIKGKLERKITSVSVFSDENRLNYYTISFESGFIKQYPAREVDIRTSCLTRESNDVFSYLKECAGINTLGAENDDDPQSKGILSSIYSQIDFIDDKTAAAVYLNPHNKYAKTTIDAPIFPFGCNASQQSAVKTALTNQISVIQGPPGTGKTQTILNIIANLLVVGKTVLVVSNNNSATENVLEKLNRHGLGFLVAPLGRKENKEAFIANQPKLNPDLLSWRKTSSELNRVISDARNALQSVESIFEINEKLAARRQELADVEIEKLHFEQESLSGNHTNTVNVSSSQILKCLEKLKALEIIATGNNESNILNQIKVSLRKLDLEFRLRLRFRIKKNLSVGSMPEIITLLEHLFYNRKIAELTDEISLLESKLAQFDGEVVMKELTSNSMTFLRAQLSERFQSERKKIESVTAMFMNGEAVLKDYPVVLSTTFSSKLCFNSDTLFDYVIMDEASQVAIETGFLALTCGKNAVIVGDSMQLPNIVKNENAAKLDAIKAVTGIPDSYDAAKKSFLDSVIATIPDISVTLLKEHYRCHPDIINFCNQKFYGGQLVIMTRRKDGDKPLSAIYTSEGEHCRGYYNQREIDTVKLELLPTLNNHADIGIIAPYKDQVNHFRTQLPEIEAATVHKYQGREKGTIIFSVTDDMITGFADNANLLNVAVSRAKDRFCLVVSGNKQNLKGNIHDLLGYITYRKGIVIKSKLHSIYDYLFSQINQHRHYAVSEYESENLTYDLIEKIRTTQPKLSHIKALCHYPLRRLIGDTTALTDRERQYAMHPATHIDLLIINRVSKEPLLAIEVDGYSYHNEATGQFKRDRMKDHILSVYNLPLLRLSTVGHSEEERIIDALIGGTEA